MTKKVSAELVKSKDGEESNSKKKELAKVEIEKSLVLADGKSSDTSEKETDISTIKTVDKEKELIGAIRLLLRHYGIRKSGAAIRDAVEMPHDVFGPSQAVSDCLIWL